jgi:hypothetical protein
MFRRRHAPKLFGPPRKASRFSPAPERKFRNLQIVVN